MSNRHQFIDNALKAVSDLQLKKQAEKTVKFQRQKEMMFDAIVEILGSSASDVIAEGVEQEIHDMTCILWGNLAFSPIGNSWCADSPQFRFAVCDVSTQKTEPVNSFIIVSDLLDFGKHLKQGMEILEKRSQVYKQAKTIPPVNKKAQILRNAADRFERGHPLPIDRLLIALFRFNEETYGADDNFYDDDHDDDHDDD